ncbi:MAG: hypothetical protein HYX83_03415 [Chloroflexi bacterium]|nr:hypothetical protein [Chloroflexota bacterium]
MSYLAVCKVNAPLSPQLMDAYIAQCAYCEEKRKGGEVTIFSPLADFSGGIAIISVEKPEDAMKIIASSPIFPYVKVELLPMVSWQFADKLAKQMQAAMAKQK